MRRCISFALALVVLVFAGCSNITGTAEPLSSGDDQLSYSMRKYFDTEDNGYAVGKQFSAKIINCTKVKYTAPDYGVESIYKYEIAIAPKNDQPMNKVQVKVFPTNGIYEHLEALSKKGDRKVNLKQGFILGFPEMNISHKSELIAFKYDFYMSNFGDDAMQAADITDEELDKGMTNLRIEVFCDGKTDVLELSYGPQLQTVTRPEDDIALTDSSVYELVTQGRTIPKFGEY